MEAKTAHTARNNPLNQHSPADIRPPTSSPDWKPFNYSTAPTFEPPALVSIDYRPDKLYSPLAYYLFHKDFKTANRIRI